MKKLIFCLLLLWIPLVQAESCYKKEMNIEQLTQCANQGDAIAENNLGVLYNNGQGVPQDYEKAVEWYSKSAKQGFVRAQFNLGLIYGKGQGVPQDYKKAFEWTSKAAEQGHAKAQHYLGLMYCTGQGVSQDCVLAYMWINLATSQGDADAKKDMENIAKKITPAEIAKAKQMANDWLAKHPATNIP